MLRSDAFFFVVLRRIPFSLALACTIFVTSVLTGTLAGPIDAGQLATWGFGAADLTSGRWYQVALAAFQIIDPYLAVSMLATVLALVGACEYRLGTARTVLVFAATHVLGAFAVVAAAKVLAARGSPWGMAVVSGREVGASAGAIGALAAWLTWVPGRLRWPGVLACGGFLLIAFLGQVHPWDVAHTAAFGGGIVMGITMRRMAAPTDKPVANDCEIARRQRLALAWILSIVGLTLLLAPFTICDALPLGGPAPPEGTVRQNVLRWILFLAGVSAWWGAGGIRRGERRAWRTALGVGGVASVGLWQPGAPGVEYILALLLVAALWVWRRRFQQPSQPATPMRAAGPGAAATMFVVFGFIALRAHFVPPFDPLESVRVALSRLALIPVDSQGRWDSSSARWFLSAIPFVVYGGLLSAIVAYAQAKSSRKPPVDASSSGGRAKPE